MNEDVRDFLKEAEEQSTERQKVEERMEQIKMKELNFYPVDFKEW